MPLGARANPHAARPIEQTDIKSPGRSTDDPIQGRRLFIRDCAHCHGMLGDGNSRVRRTLHPAPLDLTRFELTESYILEILHDGVQGSDMPAWHVSSEIELRTVSAYVARLGHPDSLGAERYASSEALKEAGRRIYVMHCSRCHGQTGKGDGKDAIVYRPGPPSFQGMRPSYKEAKRIIESGVPGSAMAAWPLLTPQEIQAVTYYVRSLYARAQTEMSSESGERR